MSFKLLKEYLYFDKNRADYTEKEKEDILNSFEQKLKEVKTSFIVV
jgi:hypothetical protein